MKLAGNDKTQSGEISKYSDRLDHLIKRCWGATSKKLDNLTPCRMTPLTLTDLSSSASKTIRCDVAAERVSKIDLAALLDEDDADGQTKGFCRFSPTPH